MAVLARKRLTRALQRTPMEHSGSGATSSALRLFQRGFLLLFIKGRCCFITLWFLSEFQMLNLDLEQRNILETLNLQDFWTNSLVGLTLSERNSACVKIKIKFVYLLTFWKLQTFIFISFTLKEKWNTFSLRIQDLQNHRI